MEAIYHYYAFISYSTTDSKWAKWLQHQLSYYHIPSSVKKSKLGIPQKLRPIFIYEYDLAGNQLHKEIEKELNASKYLIVICSPESAKSIYVNREIEYFIKQGRQEYIIPFIVGGEVNSQEPSNECFPPALLKLVNSGGENEIRGINISTNGKKQALVDVVATMLGVRKDILWNRYKKRLLKQRIMMALLVLFALLGCLLYWDYTRSTYEYYVDYVDKWGVPQGVLQLEKKDVKHRYGTYRFEYKRIPIGEPNFYDWRLHKVSYINSYGRPIAIDESEHIDRFPIQEFVYSPQEGSLTDIKLYNEEGKEIVSQKISSRDGIQACIADLENYENDGGSGFSQNLTTINIDPANETKSKIMRYVYERDGNGYIKKVTFHANNDPDITNSKISDISGIWGIEYELDSLGRRTCVRYINDDSTPISNKIGISSRQYKYDDKGIISEIKCYNLNGKLTLNEELWAISKSVCDKYGNCTENIFLGVDYKPIFIEDDYAKVIIKYDERGNRKEISYYDVDDNLCKSKEGFAKVIQDYNNGRLIKKSFYARNEKLINNNDGFAVIIIEYENNGKREKISFLDSNLKPCYNKKSHVCKFISEYNEEGELISQSFYNENGKPTTRYQVHKWLAKFDKTENSRIETYRNTDNKPCTSHTNIAITKTKFNKSGRETEIAFYNIRGELCIHPLLNYAIRKTEYDNYGRIKEQSYYNEKNEPCIYTHGEWTVLDSDSLGLGSYKWRAKYDNWGNRIEMAYYGIDDKPCVSEAGYAIHKSKYKNGNKVQDTYYNADSALCVGLKGAAIVCYNYNEKGLCVEESYLGVDSLLCLNREGYAKTTYKYNERGKIVEALFFDTNNRLCCNNYNYAKIISKYDSHGRIIESAYYDPNNKLCTIAGGYAQYIVKYDADGHKIEESYYDSNGDLCIPKFRKYAKCITTYDGRGLKIEETFYKPDRSKKIHKYNEKGNVIEESYYDSEENLYIPKGRTYARIIRTYDDRVKIEELCYKPDGSKVIYKYNKQGKITEELYYDTTNNLCKGKDGFAKLTYTYNKEGNLIEKLYYGEEGNKKNHKYDEKGNEIEISYYDSSGDLCYNTRYDEYAKIIRTYDDRVKIEELCYKPDGSKEIHKYDKKGNEIEESYYDSEENLYIPKGRTYARIIRTYDDRVKIEELCYKPDGSKEIHKYDKKGNKIEESYYDSNGNLYIPVGNRYGKYTKIEDTYDDKGNKIKVSYKFDGSKEIMKFNKRGRDIEESYYDSLGRLCLNEYGYAKSISNFNKYGTRRLSRKYYDCQGKLTEIKYGYAQIVYKYDNMENLVGRSYHDIDGKYCRNEEDYAKWQRRYDVERHEDTHSYYDEFGNLCINKRLGYAKHVTISNSNGKIIEESFYDSNNKLCINNDGYAKWRRRYDEKRNSIIQTYHNELDNLCINKGLGYAKHVTILNINGETIEESYYNSENKLCINNDGYAKIIYKYNKDGNMIEVSYYNSENKLCVNNDGYAKKKFEEISKYDDCIIYYDANNKKILTFTN